MSRVFPTIPRALVALGATAASPLLAQDPAIAPDSTGSPDIAPDTGSRLSASLGLDWTSAYFFRGYLQEDDGLILQPWVEIGAALIEPNDAGDFGLDLAVGSWNSFHSEQTGATGDGADSWYESDFYASLATSAGPIDLGAVYTVYMYPNSDFPTVHEIGAVLGLDVDDGSIAERIVGDPSFGVYFELDNSNVSDDEAVYAQLDWGPSFDVFNERATLAFPMTLGLSLSDYYEDDSGDDAAFGYFTLSAELTVPLHSGEFGEIALTAGGTLLVLGDAAGEANNDDDVDGYGYVGIAVAF